MKQIWTKPLEELDVETDTLYFIRKMTYELTDSERIKISQDAMFVYKGYYCGYAAFPEPPCPIDWINYESFVDVHGGVTYYDWDKELNRYVVGFDCAHAGDDENPNCDDLEWVLNEAKFLGKQILWISKYAKQYESYTRQSDRTRLMKKIMKEVGELKR